LTTDKYADASQVKFGDVGYIIEVHYDAYEVEFSRADGTTVAQITAQESDVELAPEVGAGPG
jgi:hypothetical protein